MGDTDWAAFWNERYAGDELAFGAQPNAFLAEQAGRINEGGRVLVPADGEGRNGVWLAERGFAVTSFDLSPRGVAKARDLAAARKVTLHQEVADATEWDWPEAAFDAVALIFFLVPPAMRTTLHARAAAALRPGGLVILECYRKDQILRGLTSGGPKRLDMLPDPDDLRADFAGLETLMLEAADPVLDEGPRHRGPAATLRYVGRRG